MLTGEAGGQDGGLSPEEHVDRRHVLQRFMIPPVVGTEISILVAESGPMNTETISGRPRFLVGCSSISQSRSTQTATTWNRSKFLVPGPLSRHLAPRAWFSCMTSTRSGTSRLKLLRPNFSE